MGILYSPEIDRHEGGPQFGSEFGPVQAEPVRTNERIPLPADDKTNGNLRKLARSGSLERNRHTAHTATNRDLHSRMATRDDVLVPSTESCPINGEMLPFNPILITALVSELK